MKQILVPTDFSECSDFAVKAARNIAKRTGARIYFLHVLSLPVDWINLPKPMEENYPEIKAMISEHTVKLRALSEETKASGIDADYGLSFSESYTSLVNHVKDIEHDLIVIGSHGSSGKQNWMIGSNAQKVMRRAKTPVLVVQKDPEALNWDTIVFATGLESDTGKAFSKLLAFSGILGASDLHLIEVNTPNNFKTTKESMKKMADYLLPFENQEIAPSIYNHTTVEAGIIEYARSVNADLIAIATHGRTDLSRIFVESIPENLVKYADFPLLSIWV